MKFKTTLIRSCDVCGEYHITDTMECEIKGFKIRPMIFHYEEGKKVFATEIDIFYPDGGSLTHTFNTIRNIDLDTKYIHWGECDDEDEEEEEDTLSVVALDEEDDNVGFGEYLHENFDMF